MANLTYIQPIRDRVEQQRRWKLWLLYTPFMLFVGFFTSGMGIIPMWLLGLLMFGRRDLDPARLSGAEGEERLILTLAHLPNEFTVLNQVYIPNPKSATGATEIDAVLISPVGIILLEAKNNSGTIIGGDEGAREWTVLKVGRGGTPYTSTMRNPVRQARRQMHTVREWLETQGVKVPIRPMVVLTNPTASFDGDDSYSVPVVTIATVADRVVALSERKQKADPDSLAKAEAALKSLVCAKH